MSDPKPSLIPCARCGKLQAAQMLVGGVCTSCVGRTMPRDFLYQIEDEIEEKEPLSLNVQGYEIQELIGGGGMGEVYRAILTARGRVVAMKVVSGRLTRDPEVTARFEAEVAALSQLSHHNVVRVLDHGETVNGRHFLVMEYVDGCDLRRLLRAQRLEVERALDIFLKVCAGVIHAHQRGIVHRDIKPANILIGADGTVKVADFGLAKTLVEDSTAYGVTQTRDTFGTPYYIAPEVTRSAGTADVRADIYALGVLLYEMLTGAVPMGQFTPLSKKTGLSKKIDSIVCHSLADDPQRRLSSVMELSNAVEKIAADHRRGRAKKVKSQNLLIVAAVFIFMGLGVAVGAWMTEGQFPMNRARHLWADASQATREQPWENSLKMKFVPVP
ncbi:MAG: serine/threonine protein kinase, partial [Prosthecobacter sp.]|nr:serine/threonine protein kinase [Prosthecobacter sp.]